MLGDKIRFLRKKEKMTLKELGAKVDSSEAAMSLYETNKRTPEYELLKRIAIVFKVPCAFLLGEGIFSKLDWIDEHYEDILDNMVKTFGEEFKKAYELSKDLSAIEKALLLSSVIRDIEIDENNDSATVANFYFYIDSPSYDDMFDLPSIYARKFGAEQANRQVLDLEDYTDEEREQIKKYALFLRQSRKEDA